MITAMEDRVNILRRARDDAWELVNDRLTSEADRASATASDRGSEVERLVQSQSVPTIRIKVVKTLCSLI